MKRRSTKVASQHKFSKGTEKDLVVGEHSQSILSNTFMLGNEGHAPSNASLKRSMGRNNTASRTRKLNVNASYLQHTTASRQKLHNNTNYDIPFADSEENLASGSQMELGRGSSNGVGRSSSQHNFNAKTNATCGYTPKANF